MSEPRSTPQAADREQFHAGPSSSDASRLRASGTVRAAKTGSAGPAPLAPFERVLTEHGPAVLRFCVARSGPHAGEDAFQETMISALGAYPELRDPGAVRAWLFSIAHRKTIDAARADARRPRPAGAPEEMEASSGVARVVDGSGWSPLSTAARASGSGPTGEGDPARDATGSVWERVRSLPPKQREAVTLRYLADLSNLEIAQVMDISPEAVRRNVFEGLRRLRALVDRTN